MEKNFEPRDKSMHLWPIDSWQGQNQQREKEQSFQQMVLEKLDTHMQNKQSWTPVYHTTSRNLNLRAKTLKLFEENIGLNFHDLRFGNVFLDITPTRKET